MQITSPAFQHNSQIPSKYTCDGENINPPLQISDVPQEAQSLVLIMEDPDVPKDLKPDGMFDHWVIYNMPPGTKEIKEAAKPPGKQGVNSAGKNAYAGACPPDREHRYFFKLFALSEMLDLPDFADKAMVEEAMDGLVLAEAELIGLYNRNK